MIGQTVSHYRILGKLGGGGMGVVYEAEDIKLGRHVALKFIPENLVGDAKALERFEREARAASQLNHPHICTIHGIEENKGHPFIVMEKLEGQSLKQRISGHAIELDEVLDTGIQVADALAASHAKGIVHRDIKPANIFLTPGGQVKVPIVFRCCMYYACAVAAQHSDRPHPIFMNMPGFKIIAPSTPADMKGLLKSAIRDDDPVLSFEDGTLWAKSPEQAEAIGDALHHGCGVGQAMQRGGDFDQDAGAAVLFAGKLVQPEGFECGAELGRQDRDFGYRILVKAGMGRTLQECNGTDHFP